MNCNDVKNYFKEKARMCATFSWCWNCPLYPHEGDVDNCDVFQAECPEQALEIVQKWSDEHPVKTRMSVFLEAFPNAPMREEGYPKACPELIFGGQICNKANNCEECWHTPMEESNE